MLKKVLLLMLSVNLFAGATNNDPVNEELTPRQKAYIRFEIMAVALAFATECGTGVVSWLPEKTHYVIKAAVFVPIACLVAATRVYCPGEEVMFDFHKRHRWLLWGI